MKPGDIQDLTMEKIKEQVRVGNFRFTIHGLERCIERQISPAEAYDPTLSPDDWEENYKRRRERP